MNGYFKGFTSDNENENENNILESLRPKEPPTVRMQTEPLNTPRFSQPEPESTGEEQDNFSAPAQSQIESLDSVVMDDYMPPYMGRGSIVVQAFLAKQALPLENVKITIKSVDGAPVEVNETMYTDEDGRTEAIFLPAPDVHLSMQAQDTIQPYAVYNIEAELDGFVTEPKGGSEEINALVFDRVCSIQNVEMIPVPESGV